jgi:predicted thioesterase
VTFQISARDDRELIAHDLHKRAVIRIGHFGSRVREKSV